MIDLGSPTMIPLPSKLPKLPLKPAPRRPQSDGDISADIWDQGDGSAEECSSLSTPVAVEK